MTEQDLETVYEAMAQAIDGVGESARELYLAKLALALAVSLDDKPRVLAAIEDCKTGLERP